MRSPSANSPCGDLYADHSLLFVHTTKVYLLSSVVRICSVVLDNKKRAV